LKTFELLLNVQLFKIGSLATNALRSFWSLSSTATKARTIYLERDSKTIPHPSLSIQQITFLLQRKKNSPLCVSCQLERRKKREKKITDGGIFAHF